MRTECSEDELPLDPDFASILLAWKLKSAVSDLIFPSPKTGRCYHASPIQQDWIRRAGWCLVTCPECGAIPGKTCTLAKPGRGKQPGIPVHDARRCLAKEKGLGSIGWHTYRHSYRSLLSGEETPLDVQQNCSVSRQPSQSPPQSSHRECRPIAGLYSKTATLSVAKAQLQKGNSNAN